MLTWGDDGVLRAEDIPYDASMSIKQKIESMVFGTHHQTGSAEAQATTTSQSEQTALLLTAAMLPIGSYRVGWYFEYSISTSGWNGGSNGIYECLVNGSAVCHIESESEDYIASSGMYEFANPSESDREIKITYKVGGSNTTAKIRNVRLEIWRTE